MNNQTIQTLQNILEALMTVSVKGADTITMGNVLQAMQQVIDTEQYLAQQSKDAPGQEQSDFIPEVEE